jgi:hypothetical protein
LSIADANVIASMVKYTKPLAAFPIPAMTLAPAVKSGESHVNLPDDYEQNFSRRHLDVPYRMWH